MFEQAKKDNKLIKINNGYELDVCIDIDSSEITMGGCNQCKNIYCNITFSGHFYENNQVFSYYGKMSSYDLMCKCQLSNDQWNKFDNDVSLLFSIHIERANEYLCVHFVNSNDKFEFVDK